MVEPQLPKLMTWVRFPSPAPKPGPPTLNRPQQFSTALLAWYDRSGRKDLPWHQDRDPYRIWVSEIMLQQTQVSTVIPYFQRFIERFPNIAALADAPLDEVLHLWTGLGYYARARNLHRAAPQIMAAFGGTFPRQLDQVCSLPGVGRSTAGAILAFAFNQRHPILDGNVKRVLARLHRVSGWPGQREVEKELWQLADRYTPQQRVADYTQAIMDLGATLCRRRKPLCGECPVAPYCAALAQGDAEAFPQRKPKTEKPTRYTYFVMVQHQGQVLLEQRPPSGVWGGLWVFPQTMESAAIAEEMQQRFGLQIELEAAWPTFRHSFTHFHLEITPMPARLRGSADRVMENTGLVWYKPNSPDARGLAAPVKQLLARMR